MKKRVTFAPQYIYIKMVPINKTRNRKNIQRSYRYEK